MKKKLLAVVLSVVMLAALFVPMMAISAAEAPTATLALGKVESATKTYHDSGESVDVLRVPVYIEDNTGYANALNYKVISNDGLECFYDSWIEIDKRGQEKTIENKGFDEGTFEEEGLKFGNTIGHLSEGNKTYFQVLQTTVGIYGIGTEEGLLGYACFIAPTKVGTYTFELEHISSVDDSNPPVQYVITIGEGTSYTVECKSHVPGEPEVTKEPDCENAGEMVTKCTACGAEMNKEPIAKLGHDWDDGVVAENVKCGETADTTFTCKREGCNETKVEKGAVVNHNMVADAENSKPAKCDEDGVAATKCDREGCTYTETKPIEKLGHDWDDGVVAENVKCGDTADTTFTCKRDDCGETKVEKGAVVKHIMVADAENSKPAKCDEDGVEATKCAREGCTYTETKPIEKLGHAMESDQAAGEAPTCTEDGKVVDKCTREGCDEVEVTPIPALGHDMVVDEENSKEATCYAEGVEAKKCSRDDCDHTETKPIAKTEHAFDGEIVVITAPTAEAEGKYTVACSNEGCTEVEERAAKKLAAAVENKENGISVKAENSILPEDLTYELNDAEYDKATNKYSAVLTFASKFVNNLSGEVEVALDVEGAANFTITTVDAEGNEVPVEFTLKNGVLTFNANLDGEYNLTFEQVKSPATSDASNAAVFAVVALVAVAGLVVVGKKRFAL